MATTAKRGSPDEIADRIIARTVIAPSGCLAWIGAKFWNGYGRIKAAGKDTGAHRVAYELVVGKILPGLHIDHLCRNHACVNPFHLEAVTCRENLLRGETFIRRNAQKTHCDRGHAFSGPNLFVRRDGRRRCRTCNAASVKRRNARPDVMARHAAYERNRKAKLREMR